MFDLELALDQAHGCVLSLQNHSCKYSLCEKLKLHVYFF